MPSPFNSIGAIIAVIVVILAILGLFTVLPSAPIVMFGLIAALAVARLV